MENCKPLTTFVQTDTNAFREIVQRLTGPSESDSTGGVAAAVNVPTPKKSKLHERRQCVRPKLEIVKPPLSFKPRRSPSPRSSLPSPVGTPPRSGLPSPVGTPSAIFSKLTLLEDENREETAICELNAKEEEKAVKDGRFYLHPSPRSRPGYTEPELLTLFPLTSPRTSEKP